LPEVSVIIPTYNRAQCIKRAIQSVIDQTFRDVEIIVVDDGSTDDTEESVKSISDQRISYIRCEMNRGSGAARNEGLKVAQGNYIAFLDSDDEWLPAKLSRQVERMDAEPPQVGVCLCGARIFKNGDLNSPVAYVPKNAWEHGTFRRFVMGRIMFLTPTVLFRRACLAKIGLMVPEMRRNQDVEFLLRLLYHFDLAVIPQTYTDVHLVVSATDKHYDALKVALPYHLRHCDLIRNRLGYWPSVFYKSNCHSNVLAAAIRERRWRESGQGLWQRIWVFPILLPSELNKLTRALVGSFLR